jgi:hypothetical protein
MPQNALPHYQQRSDALLGHKVDGFRHGRPRRNTEYFGALVAEQGSYLLHNAASPQSSHALAPSLTALPAVCVSASVNRDRVTAAMLVTMQGMPGQAQEITGQHARNR